MRIRHLCYLFLAFVLGGLCAFLGRRWLHRSEIDNRVAKPPVVVEFAETNLPIVLINTDGKCKQMTQERSILAKMSIIYNGDNQLNYVDTIRHRNQCFEYEGYASIHVRGASSSGLDKKSFALRLVADDGTREKHSFFGWKKSSKWCLLAEHKDGSLIRDALTYELARPYFDFVPHLRHCEVVIDGVYQGVYLIAEKVSRDRLGIKKVDKNDAFCSGGYIIEKNRNI